MLVVFAAEKECISKAACLVKRIEMSLSHCTILEFSSEKRVDLPTHGPAQALVLAPRYACCKEKRLVYSIDLESPPDRSLIDMRV